MRRPLRRPLAIAVVALHLCLGAWSVGAQASPATLTPAQMREDLQQLRRVLLDVEKSWTDPTWAAGVTRLDALVGAADTLTMAAFSLGIAQVVASADNAHSSVPLALVGDRFDRVPLRLVPFGTAFHVLRAAPAHADLLGARLVSVDGRGVAALRTSLHSLNPGTPSWRDRFLPSVLESPEQLHALGLAATKGAATYRLELADGRTIERRLVAEPPSAGRPRGGSNRWLLAPAALSEGWPALRSEANSPWSLREPTQDFRMRAAEEMGALVIEMRRNFSRGSDLSTFMDSVRAEIARLAPRHLIVDLRLNGGGNLQLTRDFMRELPTRVPGRVFVLTSPWTFSAAISSTGYLKQSAPERVVIVGEEVGDRLMFWSEGSPTTLTHSRLLVGTATQRHDYANGCKAYTDCHGPVVRFPVSVGSLAPEIAAPWTFAAYREGRDPAMEAVAAWLKRQPSM